MRTTPGASLRTGVALRHRTVGNNDIWVKELPDGLPRRLTFGTGADYFPWWKPDGRTISYLMAGDVWTVAAEGTGEPTLLFDGERDIRAGEWSPDGDWLVLRTAGNVTGQLGQANRDIMALRPGRDSVASPLVATVQFAEDAPALSPDGRWLAFASDETGNYEVWVRPFPDVQTGKYRVSAEGGRSPRWAHSGRELFYLGANNEMVAAEIDTSSGIRVVGSETLFTVPPDFLLSTAADPFDVALDDQRFLMARSYTERRGPGRPAYVLVQNFFEELRERVPN